MELSWSRPTVTLTSYQWIQSCKQEVLDGQVAHWLDSFVSSVILHHQDSRRKIRAWWLMEVYAALLQPAHQFRCARSITQTWMVKTIEAVTCQNKKAAACSLWTVGRSWIKSIGASLQNSFILQHFTCCLFSFVQEQPLGGWVVRRMFPDSENISFHIPSSCVLLGGQTLTVSTYAY